MKTALRKAFPLLLCLILCICLSPAAGADSTYTISFDANGGYGSMDPQEIFLGGREYTEPEQFLPRELCFFSLEHKA